MRKALIIGIDKYPNSPLFGCENDAASVASILEKNGDGSPNFDIKLISSDSDNVTSDVIQTGLGELFSGDAETALFYFAGHGIIDPITNTGYIVSQDGKKGSWGISLAEILGMANDASPRIKSTVIILDSCNSGYAGEVAGLNKSQISVIGNGVTILTACHREQAAAEDNEQGLFTSILLDGLSGGSADILGRITPASVYSHIDQTLGSWEQRPIYKANVQTFVTLRHIAPKISPDILRRLPVYFKNPTDEFSLDPSFEPDRKNIPENLRSIPVNEDNIRTFKELQLCNRYGLVIPIEAEHMYYAAINSKACKLTALGAHYRKLAELGRI
ncbi:MAG: caspase family protein [Parcubacteria group bacterium]|jgi:hypothetical protein